MTTDQDIYTTNLIKELVRVQMSFLGKDQKEWGSQGRFADFLKVSKPTLNAILKGKRPGTGKTRDGELTFMQKIWHYAAYYAEEPDKALRDALIAYLMRDPAYLPDEKRGER